MITTPTGLFFRTMGKLINVTHICDTAREANKVSERSGMDIGVIACLGNLVLMANVHNPGVDTLEGSKENGK